MLFATDPVTIAIEMSGVTWVATPDGRGASGSRRRAIGIVGNASRQTLLPLGGRCALALRPVTMTAAILPVVMTAVGSQAARMALDSERQEARN